MVIVKPKLKDQCSELFEGYMMMIFNFLYFNNVGYMERKQESGVGGIRAAVRSWRSYYVVLCGQLLCFFRDQQDFLSAKAAAPPVAILNVSLYNYY